MAVYVIADLHLATANAEKSMEVFGNRWINYIEKLKKNWTRIVDDSDTVIIPGDISWGLMIEETVNDFLWLEGLPGKKIIMKGNHDFWWSTASKINAFFEKNNIKTIQLLNNNAYELESYIIAGSRGWFTDKSMQNVSESVDYEKIVNREAIRLKMSLAEAVKLRGDTNKEIIVFLHFPPIWGEYVCEPIFNALKEFDIHRCYFGHVHGSYAVSEAFEYDNIKFHIISADFLDFIPKII